MSSASATARGWRNATVVREHDSRGTRWLVALVAGLFVALSPFAFYLLEQIDHVRVRYRIEELRSQQARLLEAERRLETERAALEALPGVEARALRELGLVDVPPDRAVVVPPAQPRPEPGGRRTPDEAREGAR